MDIAKIRKKYKETVQEIPREPGAEPPGEQGKESLPGVQAPLKEAAVTEGGGRGAGPAQEEAVSPVVELLTFSLAKEEYAFRIEDVQEIIRPMRITKIPNAHASLLGITSLRGKIIPVIDMKKRLSLEARETGDVAKQKIIIVKGPKGQIGVLIDRVAGVIRVAHIVESPAHLPETEMKCIEGVAVMEGRFISILRIEETIAL